MSKLKKYLIVTTASLLAVSGLFYIVNNYDSDYLNRGLADIFSIKKAFAVQAGCTQGPCIQTVDPSPYCSSTGCTSYGCTSTGCTAYNDPPPYCASFGCTSFGCVARNSKGQCVAGGCTGYGCTQVVDPPPQCVATGCTSYGCTGYGCTGYTDPSPYCSAYGPDICPVNGFCGSSVNSCSVGLFVDTIDNSTYYLWNCQGKDGGSSATCSYTIPYNLYYTASGGAVSFSSPGVSCGTNCRTYSSGTSVTVTAYPFTGYTFIGWSGACTNTSGTCAVTMSSGRTLSAIFIPTPTTSSATGITATSATMNGTVNANGNSGLSYKVCVTSTTTSCSVSVGFSGSSNISVVRTWTGLIAGTSYSNTIVITNSSGTTLATSNATSFRTNYLLNYTTSGDGLGSISFSQTGASCGTTCMSYSSGTNLTLTATVGSNSLFVSWSGCDSTSGTYCFITNMNSSKNVSARFEAPKILTVTKSVSIGTGGGVVASSPSGINCGATCSVTFPYNTSVTLTATTYPGYIITWSGCDSSAGTTCTVAMSTAKSVTATFTLMSKLFKVTTTGSGLGTVTAIGGINCGSSCQAIFPYGTTVFPQVTPASGSVFTGWKSVEQGGDCPSTALCPIRMADKDVTVTANFEASKTLTVNKTKDVAGTVTSSPVGIKCGISCGSASKSYPYNTTVILKAFPSTSYNFSSWSGCNSSSGNSCTVNVNGDKTVTANFTVTKKYDLKISKSGKGTGYVTISKTGLSNIKCKFNNIRTSSCTGKYANDGKITLTATANPGSEFASWGGVCVGKSPCSISVDSPKDVTAYFNKI